ncbi:unnamed protein product, partial [Strongylus vulgaris]
MDGGILVDAIVTALSDSTKDFCQSAIVGLRHINDVCRAVIPDLEVVLVGMTDQVSCGAVDMAVGAIEKLLKRCLTNCKLDDPKVAIFMNCIADQLFSGSQNIRNKTLSLLTLCAEVLGESFSALMYAYRHLFVSRIGALVALYKSLLRDVSESVSMDISLATGGNGEDKVTLCRIGCVAVESVLCPLKSVVQAAEDALLQVAPVNGNCVRKVGEHVFAQFREPHCERRNSES